MSQDTSGSAFPIPGAHMPNGEWMWGESGMTLRQYAAIAMKTPDSGSEWLNSMIRKSQRDELAASAIQGMLSKIGRPNNSQEFDIAASAAYRMADAMLDKR